MILFMVSPVPNNLPSSHQFVQTSIVVLFMTSSFAHLLNCISFRARHICFCSDYAAILYYTIGCALVNAATVVPNIIWNDSFLTADLYLRSVDPW